MRPTLFFVHRVTITGITVIHVDAHIYFSAPHLMEFTLVTIHSHSCDFRFCFKDGEIVSIPTSLLVFLGCDTEEEFRNSIVHTTHDYDFVPVLRKDKYCAVHG